MKMDDEADGAVDDAASRLLRSVREQKALARRNRDVRNAIFLGGVLLGAAAGLIWSFHMAKDGVLRMGWVVGVAAGWGLGALVLSVHRQAIFPRAAACPTCGHSWEIKEGRTVPPSEYMPGWDRCPGCQQLMNETLLAKALRGSGGKEV